MGLRQRHRGRFGGNAYIAGFTTSTDLPTVNAYQSTTYGTDILLAKLAWNGTTLSYAYSTYFGGTYYDEAYAIAVDSAGSAILTGTAYSLPNTCQLAVTNVCGLPQALNGDAFVSKFSPSGAALLASVYIGGTWRDTGRGLALDSAGNVSIAGNTESANFPLLSAQQTTFGGLQDGFITRLNWNGSSFSYGYSTYVGGNSYDGVTAIAVTSGGAASATGYTYSSNFPNACLLTGSVCGIGGPPGGVNVFALQLASGGSLNYSVYLDGSGAEYGRGIALDSNGHVYLTGDTSSSNFTTQSPIQASNGGGTDAFVTKISTPINPPAARTISYRYDGLLRLIGASENPGQVYSYTYDLGGNRTDVLVNGIPTEPHRNYNAANQMIGYSYDEAGNLRGDGTWSYSYDALNRVRQASGLGQTQEYTYNGDGVLTMQVVAGTSTRYLQDVAAPLSQVLQSSMQGGSTTSYQYGLTRLAAVNGSTKTWYVSDALGSVRRTLSSVGVPGAPISYDPWGQPQYGATPPTFGFTGELQDTTTGMVNLRARWYSTVRGTFTSRDSFGGFPEQPYSLNPYQYGFSDPVLYTDPTGHDPVGPGDDDATHERSCQLLGLHWNPITRNCDLHPPPPQLDDWFRNTSPQQRDNATQGQILMPIGNEQGMVAPLTGVRNPPRDYPGSVRGDLTALGKAALCTAAMLAILDAIRRALECGHDQPWSEDNRRQDRIIVSHYTTRMAATQALAEGYLRGSTWEGGWVFVMEGRSSAQRELIAGAQSAEARIVFEANRSELMPDPEIAYRLEEVRQGRRHPGEVIMEARQFIRPGPVALPKTDNRDHKLLEKIIG